MSRLYDQKRWHRVRERKLSRDPICEGCEERPSQHVDHIKPLDKGGAAFDPDNLMALCIPCHTDKTACDKQGIRWTPPKHRGCFADGTPRDPLHPWRMGVQSLESGERTPAVPTKTELVH